MLENIAVFRSLVRLNDGTSVLLRPLTKEDREKLIEMFGTASPEDVRYLKSDITDRELVGSWVDNLDYEKVLPLVAVVNDRIVGDATLHFRAGCARHIGEVRIFLAKDFRGRGLGTLMLKAIIELAKKAGLQQLLAEVVLEKIEVIKAFRNLGFRLEATFEDYFIARDGALYDVVVLILPLVTKREYEF